MLKVKGEVKDGWESGRHRPVIGKWVQMYKMNEEVEEEYGSERWV
jgi:hypothetical protein